MKIGIATSGLWRLRRAVELLTGGTAQRIRFIAGDLDAIAGWGHKPTSRRARRIARMRGIPYIALEDGLLRSVRPGRADPPLSLVVDRSGIYYDATAPSDLESAVLRRATVPDTLREARRAMALLRDRRLSKYNAHTLDSLDTLNLRPSDRRDRVLVVDQTAGDASISGALASAESFFSMLHEAVVENPACEILLRVHPDVRIGKKRGHFTKRSLLGMARRSIAIDRALHENRIHLSAEPINPWAFLEGCAKVYCVSSQLGFEGLVAGCEVHCFGMPFYGGWGLTHDRLPAPARRHRATIEALFAGMYFDYMRYIDHDTMSQTDFFTAVETLSDARRAYAG